MFDQTMKQGDPDVKTWPLISTPVPVAVLGTLYLLIIWLGPKFMANKKPLDIRNILLVYNFGLLTLSAYMFYEFVASVLTIPEFNFICHPVVIEKKCEGTLRLQSVMWLYHISKMIEFLESVFFILRKKNNQLSFLHCYHHVSMLIYTYLIITVVPGGSFCFAGAFNCLVHVFMYGYYLLAAMGPEFQPYLWWKKYITLFQLIQFASIVIHAAFAMRADCGLPPLMLWVHMLYMCPFMFLFSQFYIKSYLKRKAAIESRKKE